MSMIRSRWAAIGAAVAVSLGAGGIGLVNAAVSSGDRAIFVPITPCRIADTRPATKIGPKASPIGPAEVHTIQAWGTNGQCTIPTDATALSLNVTALGATANSFITIWGAGTRPTAASLNPIAGNGPNPNAVNTPLTTGGAFNVYNDQGSVHIVIDVNGYYTNHNHDDRYYTKNQVDSRIRPRGYGQVRVVDVIPNTVYYDMEFLGAHAGFISARTPGGGVTCLLPDTTVLTTSDVMGGFLQDASGNDTRLYFDGTGFFGCTADEVVVLQKSNFNSSATNQSFNVLVP